MSYTFAVSTDAWNIRSILANHVRYWNFQLVVPSNGTRITSYCLNNIPSKSPCIMFATSQSDSSHYIVWIKRLMACLILSKRELYSSKSEFSNFRKHSWIEEGWKTISIELELILLDGKQTFCKWINDSKLVPWSEYNVRSRGDEYRRWKRKKPQCLLSYH